jgi:hypothetical protein
MGLARAVSDDVRPAATGEYVMVLDRFRMDGRSAVVTGGAAGLGHVFALALAEVGAKVAV